MTFQIPTAKRDLPENSFHVEIPQPPLLKVIPRKPKIFTFPVVHMLPEDAIRPLKATAKAAATEGINEENALKVWEQWLLLFDRYAPNQRARLTDDQLMLTLKAYQEHSQRALGES